MPDAECLMLNDQCSMAGDTHYAEEPFTILHSTFRIRHYLAFGIRHVGIWHLAVGIWHLAFGID
jgi:hypothetical protein